MPVNKLVIADKITDTVLCLKRLSETTKPYEDMDIHEAVLSDKTGEIAAYLPHGRFEKTMLDLVGGAVLVNGVVMNGKNMAPIVKIKSLVLAKEGSFTPSEIFDGLDEAHINGYINVMKSSVRKITDDELRGFVEACLTDDVYRQLASKPASLAYHGRYRGGALACAASVTKMACQTGLQYQKWSCGLYRFNFDWNMVIASCLLCTYGVLAYYTDPPCRKSSAGVQRGYMSVMQSSLTDVLMNGHPLSREKFDKLLNILASSVPMKSGVKATCSEGMLLRHVLMLYEELDMFDESVSGHEPEEGETYYYDSKLHRTVPVSPPVFPEQNGGDVA